MGELVLLPGFAPTDYQTPPEEKHLAEEEQEMDTSRKRSRRIRRKSSLGIKAEGRKG